MIRHDSMFGDIELDKTVIDAPPTPVTRLSLFSLPAEIRTQ